jgi:hypothetical protein
LLKPCNGSGKKDDSGSTVELSLPKSPEPRPAGDASVQLKRALPRLSRWLFDLRKIRLGLGCKPAVPVGIA